MGDSIGHGCWSWTYLTLLPRFWEWVKVPSHVDIARSIRADQLATQGRKASPLYETVRQPQAPP